jgi:hypothetical protein
MQKGLVSTYYDNVSKVAQGSYSARVHKDTCYRDLRESHKQGRVDAGEQNTFEFTRCSSCRLRALPSNPKFLIDLNAIKTSKELVLCSDWYKISTTACGKAPTIMTDTNGIVCEDINMTRGAINNECKVMG